MLDFKNIVVNNLDDAFDNCIITSMKRITPNGLVDETTHYRVKFFDGTTRDFYDSDELVRFICHWLAFLRDKN